MIVFTNSKDLISWIHLLTLLRSSDFAGFIMFSVVVYNLFREISLRVCAKYSGLSNEWEHSLSFSGYTLLRNPVYNKGLAFTEKERDAHYLRGLLPPAIVSQELQVCVWLDVKSAFFLLLYMSECVFLYDFITGEEAHAQPSSIWSSFATIYGNNGSSGFGSFYSINLGWLIGLRKHNVLQTWLFCRWEMRGFSTSFLLIMLKSYFLLFIHLLLVRPARSMGASLGTLRVFISVWKRSACLTPCSPVYCSSNLSSFAYSILQGQDSRGIEELAPADHSSYCGHWWWTYFGAWRSWMSGYTC